MVSVRLNTLDALYLDLGGGDEPWSVHAEIRVEGEVDPARLAEAARRASARHPLARARLAPGCRWEIADALGDVALAEASGNRLGEARERLLGHTPRLDRHGPFELLLAHDPGGDVVALNLHHAAGDGVSALRLMTSIARAYGDEEDPLPPVDPLEARDGFFSSLPGAIVGPTEAIESPSRIASKGGGAAGGCGFELMRFGPHEAEHIAGQRRGEAALDDVLLGALGVTVRRWNESHGGDHRTVHITMPVNLRPAEWRRDVMGNFAAYVIVGAEPGAGLTLSGAIAAATQSRRGVVGGTVAAPIAELFAPVNLENGPRAALAQRMQNLIALTGNLLVDTAVLWVVDADATPVRMGDAGFIRELWCSALGRMPLGVSVGAVWLEEQLFITLRYRHALLDASAAREFADLFRQTLLAG